LKILLAFLLALIVVPVFAEPLSDRTGLKTTFSVQVGKDSYPVETVANFDVKTVSFVDNKLVFEIKSSLDDEIGEIQIPNDITKGNLTFSLDGNALTPKVLHYERISFITLEFPGNGTHTLQVGSDFVPAPVEQKQEAPTQTPPSVDHSNDTVIVLAVVGIVIAGAAATTGAVYLKRK